MELTKKQQEGLKIALERYKNGEKYTVISGYAGSGKSFLVNFIIQAIGIPENKVAFVAYTGKAAQVLKEKGNLNPTTLHKLLYKPIPKRNGSFIFKPKESIDYSLVVVDEVSMVPGSMWKLLLSHDVYVIALGDPYQLPPVDKKDTQDVLSHPHIFLDEIMRQAQDSEIIRLSMWVREGRSLSSYQGSGKEVLITDKEEYGMLEWADQILCATNATRTGINNRYRKMLGFGDAPQVGDKIIGLSNQWKFCSVDNDPVPLTNGAIGTIASCKRDYVKLPDYISFDSVPILTTSMITEDNHRFTDIPIDYSSLLKGQSFLDDDQKGKARVNKVKNIPFDFAYAYCITVWKYQGSQNNKILLFEEDHPRDRLEHQKFLYTGITRAVDKIVIIRK